MTEAQKNKGMVFKDVTTLRPSLRWKPRAILAQHHDVVLGRKFSVVGLSGSERSVTLPVSAMPAKAPVTLTWSDPRATRASTTRWFDHCTPSRSVG